MPLIRLYANLRKIAEKKEVFITGTSLSEILPELVRQIPALETALYQDGKIRPHVVITINGNPISDAQAAVTEQDEIAVFPPIAGG